MTSYSANVRSREGAWCPNGLDMKDCELMLLGDSMLRYISEHIPERVGGFVPGVYFRSGAKVDDLFEDHSAQEFISKKTRACIIHIGTNDLKTPSSCVSRTVDSLKDLLGQVQNKSPECEIFISSIIPRSRNHWNKSPFRIVAQQVAQINCKISEFNQIVSKFCTTNSHLHFVDHDKEFWPEGQSVSGHLLARDGLHLSSSGVSTVAKTLLNTVETFQFLRSKDETSQFQASEPLSSVVDQSKPCNLTNEENAPPVGSDVDVEYPPLPHPVGKGSTASPYSPADPALVVTRADLIKISPWAAMLHRVSQRKQNLVTSSGRSKCGRLSKKKYFSAYQSSKKVVSAVRSRPRVVVSNAEKTVTTRNRFAVLAVDEEISSPSCVSSNDSHSRVSVARAPVAKVSRSCAKSSRYSNLHAASNRRSVSTSAPISSASHVSTQTTTSSHVCAPTSSIPQVFAPISSISQASTQTTTSSHVSPSSNSHVSAPTSTSQVSTQTTASSCVSAPISSNPHVSTSTSSTLHVSPTSSTSHVSAATSSTSRVPVPTSSHVSTYNSSIATYFDEEWILHDSIPFTLVSHGLYQRKSTSKNMCCDLEIFYSENMFSTLIHEELDENFLNDEMASKHGLCGTKTKQKKEYSKKRYFEVKVFGRDTNIVST